MFTKYHFNYGIFQTMSTSVTLLASTTEYIIFFLSCGQILENFLFLFHESVQDILLYANKAVLWCNQSIILKKERNNVKSNNLSKKVDERFTQIFQDCSSLLVLIARAQVIALLWREKWSFIYNFTFTLISRQMEAAVFAVIGKTRDCL